ncbi:MAG: phosphatidylserine decarboxylase family protein [Desulfovibrionaceae bacterium]
MKNEKIGIAKEGYPILFLLFATALVLAILQYTLLSIASLALLWFSVYFFRDPERVIPVGITSAVSPADGKIIKIEDAINPITNEPATLVSIFMNVFSVHVNRMPIAATIEEIHYHEGLFLNASWDKASKDNEQCSYLLKAHDGSKWTMVQISGLIARRIVARVSAGDSLEKGERYGLIRFGSRVDLYIPKTYIPTVNIGKQVFAGQSILAQLQ